MVGGIQQVQSNQALSNIMFIILKRRSITVHNNCIMNFTNSGHSVKMHFSLYDQKWNQK